MEFGEKTLTKETIYQGSLIEVEKHVVELQNKEKANREIIHHAPAVAILALNNDKLLLVKQYRKAIEKAILEIPAGLVDPGEDLLTAAKRELEEETAFQAKNWQALDKFYVSPGYLDEYLQIYQASSLAKVAHPKAQDADEHIEVFQLSFEEVQAAIEKGDICDMKTIYAVKQWEIIKLRGETK
ncbi:NUDIX hydrolase [Aerococcus urinae]|uniref:NUDIX hydrolase n=1 Tax=Aerococcus mictus TaxID=2976810 RepID=A0A1E9PH79_9LACT|nr:MULTISPECIES: NUDIX hydrolase [Aerococcus]KAA9293712.1 NUDIX hydrolase [Aerococcus mictus]MBU5610568.1 NUDIX hydrolase [Aerococcus urinae]MCY3033980.1 NUDIX hydrolase [Aerococcus mictus]MCY3063269.1 NUDIX hydrolase [Aerococcus mictus]MCY3065748.1 NUDIX hydrolase [Aerococcus mictus]